MHIKTHSLQHSLLAFAYVVVLSCLGLSGCASSPAQKAAQPADAGPATQVASTNDNSLHLVHEGKLTLASDLSFPPFEYMDGHNKKGFSIELSELICKKMGLEPNWLDPHKFDSLIPMVKQGGKVDAAWASITITDERKKEVDFSDPYLDSNQGIAVIDKDTYKDEASLNVEGVKIGVQSGTTGEEWAKENLPQAQSLAFDEITAAFAALQSGKVQAIVVDLPVLTWSMKQDALKGAQLIAEIPTGEQYGIAVSKDNPALTKKLNEALKEIKADGSYDALVSKYFSVK